MDLRLDTYGCSFASAYTMLGRIAVWFKPVFKIRVPWISWEETLLVALCLTTVLDEIRGSKLIHTVCSHEKDTCTRGLVYPGVSNEEVLSLEFWKN